MCEQRELAVVYAEQQVYAQRQQEAEARLHRPENLDGPQVRTLLALLVQKYTKVQRVTVVRWLSDDGLDSSAEKTRKFGCTMLS